MSVLTAEGYDSNSFYSQYGETTYFYNYIMPCNAELNAYTQNTYELFKTDNPRLNTCRKNITCQVKIPSCDCEILTILGIYEDSTTGAVIDYPVKLDQTTISEIRQINIDFGSDTVTLDLEQVECINPDIECECEISITSIEAINPCDSYDIWIRNINNINALPTPTVNSITLGAITYTPPAPILANDTVALDAYFNGLGINGTFYFTLSSPPAQPFLNISFVAGCNVNLNAVIVNTTNSALVTSDLNFNLFKKNVTCATVQGFLPDFECDTCNNGNVDLHVNIASNCTSGSITIDAGGGNVETISSTESGYVFTDIPATGQTVMVTVFDANNPDCSTGQEFTFPVCIQECNNYPELDITCGGCDNYELWITSDGDPVPDTANLIDFTFLGNTYTPPAPLPFTNLLNIENWLNSLGLPVYFIVILATVDPLNPKIYVTGECCANYAPGDFTYNFDNGGGNVLVTLDFLANLTCELLQSGIPDFECCLCFQATASGTVNNVNTDVIEYSYNGVDWFTYGGECINSLTDFYFRRTVTYTDGCPDDVITYQITDIGENCDCYTILNLNTNSSTQVGTCESGGGGNGCTCYVSYYVANVTPPSAESDPPMNVYVTDGQCVLTVNQMGTCTAPLTFVGMVRDLCSVYDVNNPPTCDPIEVAAFGVSGAFPSWTFTGLIDDVAVNNGSFYQAVFTDANGCLVGINFRVQA